MVDVILTINRSDEYKDISVSAPYNKAYVTIDTSDWIDKPWMFYELPALKFEIYTETNGEMLKYKNFEREIRTYNPVYSQLKSLNVTISIKNVPTSFILRIIPIFDNNSICARNMLIKNGIEYGDIWDKEQGIPTNEFNVNIEFLECSGDSPTPSPPYEETITGIPPITFTGSTGDTLISWSILGNDSQSIIPTPDAPIMPDFCGKLVGSDWTIPIINAEHTATVYLGEVPTVRRIKKRVFNGSENWTVWVYETAVLFYTNVADGTGDQIVSSHFGIRKSGALPIAGNIAYNGTSNKNMLFRMLDDTTITTVDEFKAWIADQYSSGTPVTVWYVLSEPQKTIVNEPLCKIGDYTDELHSEDTSVIIPTAIGDNTLTIGTDLQPSSMTITYMKEDQ